MAGHRGGAWVSEELAEATREGCQEELQPAAPGSVCCVPLGGTLVFMTMTPMAVLTCLRCDCTPARPLVLCQPSSSQEQKPRRPHPCLEGRDKHQEKTVSFLSPGSPDKMGRVAD